jgi:hypothetical protein
MLKRFERLSANVEAAVIAAVVLLVAIAYVMSRLMGGS